MKFDTMEFYDGGCGATMNYVGPVKHFRDRQGFLEYCKAEFGYEPNNDIPIDQLVRISYVRYYPKGIEGCYENEGCFSFTKEPKGAIKVYNIEL